MKKYLFAILMMASASTFAYTDAPVGYGSLTDAQKAEIALQVAKTAEGNKAPEPSPVATTVETVGKWANIGTDIGKALAGTARELGIVANDFIKTPAGQITLALIVWKVMGAQMVHVFGGLLILVVMIPMWVYMFRRVALSKEVVKTPHQDLSKDGAIVYTTTTTMKCDTDNVVGLVIVLGIIFAISLTTIFSW